MIRILLADDDKFIRRTLCSYLEAEPDIEIVATADNGKIALELIAELHPDLAFLDIEMPEIDGLTATETICQRYPQTKAVVLSSYDDREYVNKAIEAGAIGYLLKTITAEELSQAIRFLHKGYLQLAPGLSRKLSSTVSPEDLETNETSAVTTKIAVPRQPKLLNQTSQSSNSFLNVALDEFLPVFNRRTNIGGLILLAILGITVILTNLPKSKVTLKAPAIISSAGKLYPLQTAIEGNIRSIEVWENQIVKAGTIITRLDDSQLQTQKQQLQNSRKFSLLQINSIDAQILNLGRQIAAENRIIERISVSSNANLNFNRSGNRDISASSQAELQEVREEIKLASQELNSYRQLQRKGLISQSQLEKKEAALKIARAKLMRSQTAFSPSNENIDMASEQIIRERIQRQTMKNTFEREKEALKEEKNTIQKQISLYTEQLQKLEANQKKTIVRAPFAGIIQQLDVSNRGQFVQVGKIVAQIVPTQAPLVVRTLVSSQDIDKIQIGQTAKLSISACPNSSQSSLEGTVSAITPYIGKSEQQATARAETRTYEVKIQPKPSFIANNGHKCTIKVGMKGRVEIVARQETLLTFLLKIANPTR
jgi:HlyD family secretion protein